MSERLLGCCPVQEQAFHPRVIELDLIPTTITITCLTLALPGNRVTLRRSLVDCLR